MFLLGDPIDFIHLQFFSLHLIHPLFLLPHRRLLYYINDLLQTFWKMKSDCGVATAGVGDDNDVILVVSFLIFSFNSFFAQRWKICENCEKIN